MRPIPIKMREELASEPRMKRCAAAGLGFGPCEKKIEWDHVWIYAGKQINEKWAILGICEKHHYEKNGNRLLNETIMRASLRIATAENLEKYPRKNWAQIKKSLGITWHRTEK